MSGRDLAHKLPISSFKWIFSVCAPTGHVKESPHLHHKAEPSEHCNRLIKNVVIFWNYLYLPKKLDEMKGGDPRDALFAAIANHSPISWAQINLLGEYDFSDENLSDSVRINS